MGFSQAHSCFLPPPPSNTSSPALQKCKAGSWLCQHRRSVCPFLWAAQPCDKKHPHSPFVLLIHYKGVGSVLFKTCDLLFWRHLCFKNKVLFPIILNVALRNNVLKCSIFVLKVGFYYLLWISEGRFNPLYMKISSHFRKRLPFPLLIHSYNNILWVRFFPAQSWCLLKEACASALIKVMYELMRSLQSMWSKRKSLTSSAVPLHTTNL